VCVGGLIACAEDGKEMQLDLDKMRITDVMEEVDRHSRQLARKEELTGN
jgi:large subunit ribosomal protein L53